MSNMQYNIEYLKDIDNGIEDSVFINIKRNMPVFFSKIGKEDYSGLDESDQHAFVDGLFAISGITDVSVGAYRIWLNKSPIFEWKDKLPLVIDYIKNYFGDDTVEELHNSGQTLEKLDQKRPIF